MAIIGTEKETNITPSGEGRQHIRPKFFLSVLGCSYSKSQLLVVYNYIKKYDNSCNVLVLSFLRKQQQEYTTYPIPPMKKTQVKVWFQNIIKVSVTMRYI